MKVYCEPHGLFSPAMVRIATALKCYAPPHIVFVANENDADLVIMYVIGFDYVARATRLLAAGKRYVAVQCCVESTANTVQSEWHEFWEQAALVWSYLPLRQSPRGFNFYHSPLGVDPTFTAPVELLPPRRDLVITTGCVTGESAEAILETWQAANLAGIEAVHVGPATIEGMDVSLISNWRHVAPNDHDLANLYRCSRWVSALRAREGFELPAAEGLVAGSTPIVFDQPCMHWYDHLALFVPETHGEQLVKHLVRIFTVKPKPHVVGTEAIAEARARFDWKPICGEFWHRCLST